MWIFYIADNMKPILILLAVLVTTCHAVEKDKKTKTLEDVKPESLDVSNNFRKALIDALEQLEKDEKSSTDEKDDLDASDYDEIGRMKFGHKVRGKIAKQEAIVTSFSDADKSNVFIHSFTTNDPLNKPSKEPKQSVEKSNKVEATTVKFRTKLTTDNSLATRTSSTITENKILPKPTKKETSTAPVTPETKLTSPNPTISTPVEEEDESKQKVEDVQFIHAPLVAAFTVEQDDKGLPRKVIPIYGNKQLSNSNQFSNQNSINRYQASLDEKQRQLEQQIRILQEQRRQHDLLLLGQSIKSQQLPQNFQKPNFHHQPFVSEQKPITNSNQFQAQDFRQLRTTEQQTRINIPIPLENNVDAKPSTSRPTKEVSGTVVAFQPSIVFQPNNFNQVQKQPFSQSLNKPTTQFNQDFLQKPSTQHSQSLNPSQTQFTQNFNSNSQSQFTPNQNTFAQFHRQVDQIQGNLEGFIQNPPTQLSQSQPQNPSNLKQKPTTEFIQSISLTTDNQFTPITNNQFSSSGHFNNQALPQPAALTQFNTVSSTNQFNSGVNPTTRFNQGATQNQFNQFQFSQNQALPIKPAIDFQKAISIPIPDPSTTINQQQIPNKFRDNVFNNVNDNFIQDFLYRQRTLIPPPPRSNRFNRHETQVGNFGVNDFSHNNNFYQNQQFQQTFTPINYNNQQFRQNQFFNDQRNNFNNFNNRPLHHNQFFNNNLAKQTNVDSRLKNLIYQSGLGQGRGQEDLNIVSKVLALDHTGNYQQNLLFGASKVNERRIPFSQAKKH